MAQKSQKEAGNRREGERWGWRPWPGPDSNEHWVCEALGHVQPEIEASLAWLSLGRVGGLLSPLLMRSRYRGVIAEH